MNQSFLSAAVQSRMSGQVLTDSEMARSGQHPTGQASPQPVSCGSAASLSVTSVSDTSELQLELDDGQLQRMQMAVEALLVALGEDVQRQGLRNTPKVRPMMTTKLESRVETAAASDLASTAFCPCLPPPPPHSPPTLCAAMSAQHPALTMHWTTSCTESGEGVG